MLVVSDASPLNILIRLEHVNILPTLFGQVIIPTAVAEELSRAATPQVVRDWLVSNPAWREIRAPLHPEDPSAIRHRGEREAISLARELNADLLLVDGRKASKTAHQLGIPTVGTLGILERAADQGLLNLQRVFDRIRSETDFFVTDELLNFVLHRQAQRQRRATGEHAVPNETTRPNESRERPRPEG